MIWQDRTRTDPTKRKFIDENGNEQNVNIEEIQSNITQSGTPVNATTMNNIEKNLGTYGNDTYDSTATYLEGETVTHNALLYRAKQDIDTPEEWTAEHWEETSALGELSRTSGNEIAYGLDNITRQSKAVVYPTNYRTLNQEVNIGATNSNNIKTWFKQGKNLLPKRGTQIISGITITEQTDGSLILNGTASANVSYYYCGNDTTYESLYTIEKGGKYTLSSTTATGYFIYVMSGGSVIASLTNGGETTFTTTANATYRIFIRVSSGVSLSNIHIYPQLEEGETATTYEEYIAPQILINETEIYSKDKKEIYDTNEVVIGTWLGKPLYRKVVDFGALPNNTEKQVVTNLTNIVRITKAYGISNYTSNNATYTPIPYVDPEDLTRSMSLIVRDYGTKVGIKTSMDYSAFSAKVVLEYTKTTD